ncbi:MerR family transcriptional regulator [Polycladidibacter hongkongensis]|uniref:MerR family transcriptional regulator n=1 Tax=Polycladidibacter hongkongensis TaxID=1647556 RepID=UPI000833F75C|nr:MerR family transcriptional regulator [Pseudovibrio hongkongensis]
MKIGELARRSGLSAHTLRYYEKYGLIPPPLRDSSGQRVYGEDALDWLAFLKHLKHTGMPLSKMRRYAHLRARGDTTFAARQNMLQEHRLAVLAQIGTLQSCLDALERKIAFYNQLQQGDHADDNNNLAREHTKA